MMFYKRVVHSTPLFRPPLDKGSKPMFNSKKKVKRKRKKWIERRRSDSGNEGFATFWVVMAIMAILINKQKYNH